jgi:hypothetical protein
MQLISRQRAFNGWICKYEFTSTALDSATRFSVYLPDAASETSRVPVRTFRLEFFYAGAVVSVWLDVH